MIKTYNREKSYLLFFEKTKIDISRLKCVSSVKLRRMGV